VSDCGRGHGQWSSRSRPNPDLFEAKEAKATILSSMRPPGGGSHRGAIPASCVYSSLHIGFAVAGPEMFSPPQSMDPDNQYLGEIVFGVNLYISAFLSALWVISLTMQRCSSPRGSHLRRLQPVPVANRHSSGRYRQRLKPTYCHYDVIRD